MDDSDTDATMEEEELDCEVEVICGCKAPMLLVSTICIPVLDVSKVGRDVGRKLDVET